MEAPIDRVEEPHGVVVKQSVGIQFYSPLPPPGVLKEYGKTSEKALEQVIEITRMFAECNVRNANLDMDNRYLSAREDARSFFIGKLLGFFSTIFGFLLIAFALWLGHTKCAMALAAGELATLVWMMTRSRGDGK